ncbi:MAG: helix-turn-helix transcriptional regulator [Acidobacteriota bacterium]
MRRSVHNALCAELFTGTVSRKPQFASFTLLPEFDLSSYASSKKGGQTYLSKTNTKYPNELLRYRERIGFTQTELASLIGCRRAETVRRIENGVTIPSAMTVLRLAAALRAPVEFLYKETFLSLRDEVRAQEERMPNGHQGVLPLPL